MKTLKQALWLVFPLLVGCGPNERQKNATAEKAPTSQTEAQRQQADVLAKDTLNAVQEEVIKKPGPNASPDFRPFFENFAKTIAQEDAGGFNRWIDPDHGLYLIEAPGAVPRFTRVTDISGFRRADARKGTFFTIREAFQACNVEETQALPTLTCEGGDNNFSRQGCFLAEATAFRKSDAYKSAGLPPEEQKKIARTQLLVSRTVLHTGSGFKFHFGQIKGQWRVLFIDLMVPCSA